MLYKSRTGFLPGLLMPLNFNPTGPLCMTCGRPLEEEELVEVGRHFAKVLGKHHGEEQLATFELPTDWDDGDLARAMRSHRWFDPTLVPK